MVDTDYFLKIILQPTLFRTDFSKKILIDLDMIFLSCKSF